MRSEDFERLYEEYAQPLFGFLAYRTGNRAAAEDLLAETFERALKARWRFDRRKGTEKAWLYAIALNCLRDQQRRAGAEQRALERAHSVDDAGEDAERRVGRRDELQRGMAELSGEEREAIALRFGADLTVREIAALTGETESTVHGRVYRALRKLRERIAPGDA